MKTALFVTRAQPFHIGHLKVIKWILKKYDKIVIVIGSSQESKTEKNPFTFEQRKRMIENTLGFLVPEVISGEKLYYNKKLCPGLTVKQPLAKSIVDKCIGVQA